MYLCESDLNEVAKIMEIKYQLAISYYQMNLPVPGMGYI